MPPRPGCTPLGAAPHWLRESRKQRGAAQPGPAGTGQKFWTPLVSREKTSPLLPRHDTETVVPCALHCEGSLGRGQGQDSASPQGRSRSGQWTPTPTPGQAGEGSGKRGRGESARRAVCSGPVLARAPGDLWSCCSGYVPGATRLEKAPRGGPQTARPSHLHPAVKEFPGLGTEGWRGRGGVCPEEASLAPSSVSAPKSGSLAVSPRLLERPWMFEEDSPWLGF